MEKTRIVVKVGSSTLTYEGGRPHLRRIERLVRTLSDLKNAGHEVILVSSGAIAVGVSRLSLPGRPHDTSGRQAAAAVGQCQLMSLYDKLFSEYGHTVAQVLLTRNVVENKDDKTNVINTFDALLRIGALPIVNENDTVAGERSVFGDNDRLSAIVASLTGARFLMILTDTDGLYDRDPHKDPDARRITEVREITPELEAAAGGAGSARGTGGMRTKLEAARIALNAGAEVFFLSGDEPQKIYDALEGRPVGTHFTSADATNWN